jgi:serine/threonine protein kinase/Tol biopolymer transport system component
MSDAVRWERVKDLFQAALDRPPAERSAFLRAACGKDEDLQTEVASLLDAHQRAGSFAERPAVPEQDLSEPEGLTERLLQPGDRLGTYRIAEWLGAGGMGQVYRARDEQLERDVAIKVLPPLFVTDPDRLARFEREARLLASLNHPNIGTIYGLEPMDGGRALVLELVEGDTLADRLAGGSAIPVADALAIARQIADALEAAHEKGIVHRDLKPANIKITPDGVVKVLDFGLAKAASGEGSRPGLTQSPTVKASGTGQGVILGTAAYMSPEQASGKPVDKRTDIWAFGCVLYEMLTGRQAFEGDSLSAILARVIEREPDWKSLPSALHPRIHELLYRCLEKNPKKRRRDIGDVRVEIEQALSEPTQSATLPVDKASTRRTQLTWVAVLVLAVALAVALARLYLFAPPQASETRVDISTPETLDPAAFAISPEGRRLVFAALRNGRPQLYLRSLDGDTAEALNGTEGALLPFWSPDGRSVGFFANNQLKRIDLDGGLVQALTKVGLAQGGTWGPDGVILFSLVQKTGELFRIPASGGEPVAVTKINAGQGSHRFPVFLPGGRQFVFYAAGTEAVRGIYLGSLDSPDVTRLTEAAASAVYAGTPSAPGWLLFVRQGALVARRFDPARRELGGDPVTVAESVAVGLVHAAVSVSATGVIAYRTGATNPRQLTWFDRSGRPLGTLGEPDRDGLINVELSRDGLRVAVQRAVQGKSGVWIIDSARTSPFTLDPRGDGWPLWSPDDTRIVYVSNKTGKTGFYKRASGSNDAATDEWLGVGMPSDWSRDGRFLLYHDGNQKAGRDLRALQLDGDGESSLVEGSGLINLWGQFSPDGRWVAYPSNGSGRFEIYARPFSGPGAPVPVSTSGGIHARWSLDGKELFYIAPDGKLMAASITVKGATLVAGTPVALFQTRIVGGGVNSPGLRQQYDVDQKGRFLINVESESAAAPITLILDWKPTP